jgi:phosphoglycolate phosphatase-like HAD superfamily hydrolase
MNLLAVFDIDGTICNTQDVEGLCYARAIERVIGKSLSTLDWTNYAEPTSSAIVQNLLAGDLRAAAKEDEIKHEFVRLLEEEYLKSPSAFSPIAGAVQFIERLKREKICTVAIATGCFDSSARFKLRCCGLALDDFPHATSSNTPQRSNIIPLAVARAGFNISSAVYFGDAPWDVHVSRKLGIPMIGIGHHIRNLQTLGVPFVFPDYSKPDTIIRLLYEKMESQS